jgi:hypothetical protein
MTTPESFTVIRSHCTRKVWIYLNLESDEIFLPCKGSNYKYKKEGVALSSTLKEKKPQVSDQCENSELLIPVEAHLLISLRQFFRLPVLI